MTNEKRRAMAEKENTSVPKKQKGETFLLRLPVDLRAQLDAYRAELKAKSLQTVITQFILQGLNMPKAEFTSEKLFSKDLHARQLGMAVGQGSDLEVGNQRNSVARSGTQTTAFNPRVLIGAHERVLEALESQKLTSFAALMDPALMSYRLLLDFCTEDPNRRDPESLIRDFSNGLWFAADKAIDRKKWNFAQILLLQACDLDPENTDLGLAAGIYLIKRVMMNGWLREKGSMRVPQEKLFNCIPNQYLYNRVALDEDDAPTPDLTSRAMVQDAYDRLHRGVPTFIDMPGMFWSDRNLNHGGTGKISCWRDLACIMRWASSDENDENFNEYEEEVLLPRIKRAFREWEQSFKTMREQSSLERAWSEWLDALEVFWWLGYRKETFEVAGEVRNSSTGMDWGRFSSIQKWDPDAEVSAGVGSNFVFFDVFLYKDEFDQTPEELPIPFRAKIN